MSAAEQPDPFASEIEIDLTGEMETMKASDQRHTGRQQASSSLMGFVEYRDKKVAVRIDDLSMGGVGVSMESRLPEHEECSLTIMLTVCGADYELKMKCRTRHCDAVDRKTYSAGLQFIDMTQETRDTLTLLVR